MTTSAVDAAIAQAENLAAQTQAQALVPTNGATAVPAMPARGQRLGLQDFQAGSMAVDHYLKVKEFGLLIDKDGTLFDEIEVIIDPNEIAVTEAIKFGDPAQYYKTFDRVMCAQGGTWADAVMRAQRADSRARPYPSADIPMTSVATLKTKKGEIVVEEGARIGYSLSTTNGAAFQSFLKALGEAGLMQTPVRVKLTAEKRTNSKGHIWGVVNFTLLGAVEE